MVRSVGGLSWTADKSVVTHVFLFMMGDAAPKSEPTAWKPSKQLMTCRLNAWCWKNREENSL